MKKINCPNLAKNLFILLILSLVFAVFFRGSLYALSSDKINLQGKIVRNDTGHEGMNVIPGSPACVINGAGNDTCDFRVSYYTAITGGTLLLTEDFVNVEIGQFDGVFELSLGSGTITTTAQCRDGACNSPSEVISEYGDVYIELKFAPDGINLTETFTRMPLEASPYAIFSKFAEGAHDAFKLSTSISNGSLENPSAGMIYFDTGSSQLKVYNGAEWQALSAGSASCLWTDAGTYSYLTSTTDDLVLGGSTVNTGRFVFDMDAGSGSYFDVFNDDHSNKLFTILGSGNVGIGTATPGAKLEVGGSASTITNSTGNLTISTGGGNGNILLMPNGTGNVGIGTTNPDSRMEIVAPAYDGTGPSSFEIQNWLRLVQSPASGPRPILQVYGSSTWGNVVQFGSSITDFMSLLRLRDENEGLIFGSNAAGYVHRLSTSGQILSLKADRVNYAPTWPISVFNINTDQQNPVNRLFEINFPLIVKTAETSVASFRVRAINSQTSDLFQWQDNNSNSLGVINIQGNVGIGTTSPTHKLELATHTTAAGGIGFGTDVELYRSGANILSLASGDNLNLVSGNVQIGSTTILTSGRLVQAANGSASSPAFSFSADTNTGMYGTGSDVLRLVTAGADRVTIDANGNVGIGTTSPFAGFHVNGIPTSPRKIGAIIGESYQVNGVDFAVLGSNQEAGLIVSTRNSTVINLGPNLLGTYGRVGIASIAGGQSGSDRTTAVAGLAFNTGGGNSTGGIIGGYFLSSTSSTSAFTGTEYLYGVQTSADSRAGIQTVSSIVYGIYSTAYGAAERGDTTYAGFFNATGGLTNYGIYSAGGNNYFNGNVGIGTTSPSSKLVVNTGGYSTIKLQYNGTPVVDIFSNVSSNIFIGLDSGSAITSGTGNVALGDNALSATTIGTSNTAVGYFALDSNVAKQGSTAIGYQAMAYADNTTTQGLSYNTAVGYQALVGSATPSSNTGMYNTAIGHQSMTTNTTGSYNSALGVNTLINNTIGQYNVAVGYGALFTNVAKNASIAIGYEAMRYADNTTTTGTSGNIAVGYQALKGSTTASNNTGTNNIAMGYQSMYGNTSGYDNVMIGSYAGNANTTGMQNVAVGRDAFKSNVAKSNNVAIGYGAMLYAYNSASAGNSYNTALRSYALRGITTASNNSVTYNTSIGGQSGYSMTSGSNNALLGYYTGYAITTGSNNSLFGYSAGSNLTTGSNNIIIGANINADSATGSNQLNIGGAIKGDLSTGDVNITRNLGINGVAYTWPGSTNPYPSATISILNNNGSGGLSWSTFADLGLVSGTGSAGQVSYWSGTNSITGSDSFWWDSTNNRLGIGTNTPQASIDIAGATSTISNASGDITISPASLILSINGRVYQTGLGYSTYFGQYAGRVDDLSDRYNTGIGYSSLYNNSTGTKNAALGYYSLYSNTGSYNTAVGSNALRTNTSASYNTAVGYYSLYTNSTGTYNTALGYYSLYSNTGSYNSSLGSYSLYSNSSGTNNTSLGYYSLYSNTTGNYNVALGYQAGRYQADGSTALTDPENSIYIGYNAKGKDNNDNNSIVIGYNAVGLGANTVVLGNDSIVTTALKGNVGIGTTSPGSKLEVAGVMAATGINGFISSPYQIVAPKGLTGMGTGALISVGTTATGTNPRSIAVDPSGRFVYVTNFGSNNVQAYSINQSTGALISVGTTATGTNPRSIAVDPSGRFVYVTNFGSNNVQAYSINQSTGALISVGTTATGTNPRSIAVDPSGRFVYVTNFGSNNVQAYSINQSTGALISVGTTATGTNPRSIAVDPSGRFVYVTNFGSNNVQAYSINQSTGALISVGTTATGTNPRSIAVDPSGRFVYVTNFGSNNVQAYSINQSTGALISVGTTATGTNPRSIAVDPSGRFVYVTNFGSNNVQAYSINQSTGALISVGTTATGTNPFGVVVDPSGRFIYVINYELNNVQAYTINNFSAGSANFAGGVGAIEEIKITSKEENTVFTEIKTFKGYANETFISINPFTKDNTVGSVLRIFRNVNTTGGVGIDIFKGDNTLSVNSHLGANGDTFLNAIVGNVGIGLTNPTYRLQLPNTANNAGKGQANAWVTYSDISLKENIQNITGGLDKIMALRGVTFDWKGQGVASSGFIAQEVELVIPDLVSTDSNGIKSLDYGRFTPYLVEAIKEQQLQIQTAYNRIEQLENINENKIISITTPGWYRISKLDTNDDHSNIKINNTSVGSSQNLVLSIDSTLNNQNINIVSNLTTGEYDITKARINNENGIKYLEIYIPEVNENKISVKITESSNWITTDIVQITEEVNNTQEYALNGILFGISDKLEVEEDNVKIAGDLLSLSVNSSIGDSANRWNDIYAKGTIRLGSGADGEGAIRFNVQTKTLEFSNNGVEWLSVGDLSSQMTISPEYAGAILFADGSDNSGIMTSDAVEESGSFKNYYEWVSTKDTPQDYDILVRITLPADFLGWKEDAIYLDFMTENSVSTDNNSVNLSLIGNSGTDVQITGGISKIAGVWERMSIKGADITQCNSAGGTCTLRISLTSSMEYFTRVGDITLNYNRSL